MHVKSTVNRSRDPLATKWFCFAKGVPGRAGGHAKLAKSALLGVCSISSSVYKLPHGFGGLLAFFNHVLSLRSTPLPVRCRPTPLLVSRSISRCPRRCHKSYIINAPRAFTALWKVVSAMLDPR